MAELNQSSKISGKARSLAAAPRVDLTAMVDLAFLLITFFMLTTTLSKQNAMQISLPVDDHVATTMAISEHRSMTIVLGNDHKMLWYKGTAEKPITIPTIASSNNSNFRKILISEAANVLSKTGKSMIVLIMPGDKSQYGDLVNIIDQLELAKINTQAIVDIDHANAEKLRKAGID